MTRDLFWLAFAGALGTLCRYGLQGFVQRIGGERFPWGTLAVNAAGCFLFGLIWSLAIERERLAVSAQTRTIVFVGFMGAFTTFSTFAYETSEFLRVSQWGLAAGNVLAHNLLGLACLFLGFTVSRWI
ncbi:MAG: CrcB family protein [Planctomycetales bacterium]